MNACNSLAPRNTTPPAANTGWPGAARTSGYHRRSPFRLQACVRRSEHRRLWRSRSSKSSLDDSSEPESRFCLRRYCSAWRWTHSFAIPAFGERGDPGDPVYRERSDANPDRTAWKSVHDFCREIGRGHDAGRARHNYSSGSAVHRNRNVCAGCKHPGQRWQGMARCASGVPGEICVNSRSHGQPGI